MRIEYINLKEDLPISELARANLEIEIERLIKTDTKVLKILHGYGSHGVGGEIKKQTTNLLKKLKEKKVIKDFSSGEKLSIEFIKKHNLYVNFPELLLDSDLKNYNSGISIVIFND